MTPVLRVLSGGVLTTVQDLGRTQVQRYGVPVGGAMDRFALAIANRLVGNPPAAAALEITSGGALFEAVQPTMIALTGAALGATLDGAPLWPWTATPVLRGAQIALPGRREGWGARACLALAGGVAVPPLLGSRSTYLPSGFGGMEGRPLQRDDLIAAGPPAPDYTDQAGSYWPASMRPPYGPNPVLRFLPGPHLDCFPPDGLADLAAAPFRLSSDANRMGYRLEGAVLRYARPCSLPSLGALPGAVQVPPDGRPILLMADAQTVGGYPIIGVVIETDLPLAAQLLPGDTLRFAPVTREAALHARRQFMGWCEADLEVDPTLLLMRRAGAPGA